MARRATCHLFAEDRAQEALASALIQCAFFDTGVGVDVAVKSASGGFGPMLVELGAYRKVIAKVGGLPDLLVVMIDEDGQGSNERRDMVTSRLADHEVPYRVVGVPAPRIEDWYLLDANSVAEALELEVGEVQTATHALDSKQAARTLVAEANALQLVGDLEISEFAAEIVGAADCPSALKTDRALRRFINDLSAAAKQLALARSDDQ